MHGTARECTEELTLSRGCTFCTHVGQRCPDCVAYLQAELMAPSPFRPTPLTLAALLHKRRPRVRG
jgi:hypothetical protein